MTEMQPPDFKLAKVCWIDSRVGSAHWQHLETIQEDGICRVWSVGWVINDTDEHLQICPHLGHDPDQGCGEMSIPKIAIVSIEYDDEESDIASAASKVLRDKRHSKSSKAASGRGLAQRCED